MYVQWSSRLFCTLADKLALRFQARIDELQRQLRARPDTTVLSDQLQDRAKQISDLSERLHDQEQAAAQQQRALQAEANKTAAALRTARSTIDQLKRQIKEAKEAHDRAQQKNEEAINLAGASHRQELETAQAEAAALRAERDR